MKTETTEFKDSQPLKGWIGFDATCGACVGLAGWLRSRLLGRGYEFVPLQGRLMRRHLGRVADLREPALLTTDDRLIMGSDIAFEIARDMVWARPLHWIAMIPGVRRACRKVYRGMAGYRYEVGGVCGLPTARETRTQHRASIDQAGGRPAGRRSVVVAIHRMFRFAVEVVRGFRGLHAGSLAVADEREGIRPRRRIRAFLELP